MRWIFPCVTIRFLRSQPYFSPQRKNPSHCQPKDCNFRLKWKSRNEVSVKEHGASLLPVIGCSWLNSRQTAPKIVRVHYTINEIGSHIPIYPPLSSPPWRCIYCCLSKQKFLTLIWLKIPAWWSTLLNNLANFVHSLSWIWDMILLLLI